MIRNKRKVFKLTKEDMKEVKKFVALRTGEEQHEYNRRGGFKEEDIWVGAMAEIAAYHYLKKKGMEPTYPDFTIHNKKDKSYEADLKKGKKRFHVKGQSQRSAKLYGDSWLLQRYDKIVKKPLINNYLILCNVDIENGTVEILGTVSTYAIHKNGCWGECKHPAFRHSKVALYMTQLYDQLSTRQLWSV
jgi:hypothetical protein